MRDVDSLYVSGEKDGADDSVSENTVAAAMIGEEDKNSATDVWPDFSKAEPIE